MTRVYESNNNLARTNKPQVRIAEEEQEVFPLFNLIPVGTETAELANRIQNEYKSFSNEEKNTVLEFINSYGDREWDTIW